MGALCHSRCDTLKNPRALLNGHKCPSIGQNLQPFPVMVTSPNEWKILEWDENTPIKQTNKTLPPWQKSLLKVGFLFDWFYVYQIEQITEDLSLRK